MMREMRLGGTAAMVLAAAWLTTSAAHAQSGDMQTLIERMERMERDVQALNRNVYRGGGATPTATSSASSAAPAPGVDGGSAASLIVRMSEMEANERALTGQIESLNHAIRQINQRLDKLVSDMDFRLGALEKGRALTPEGAPGQSMIPQTPTAAAPAQPVPSLGASQPSQAAPGPGSLGTLPGKDAKAIGMSGMTAAAPPAARQETALPSGSPKDQYDFALALLQKGEYDKAEGALAAFLKANPKDVLTNNARYWLGETYYVRGDFRRAVEVFLESYQADPKGPKAPDGLLKMAMALGKLDKKRESCLTFSKLRQEFPNASPNIQKAAEREGKALGCK